MKVKSFVGAALACIVLSVFADALPRDDSDAADNTRRTRQQQLLQRKREKAEALRPYEVSDGEVRTRRLEKARFPQNIFVKGFHGVRPLIGGMPAGSGAVGGVGYVRGLDYELLRVEANARYSTYDFTQLDASAEFPNSRTNAPLRLQLDTGYHDYKSLGFFGLGNDSGAEGKTYFREIVSSVGGGVAADLNRFVELRAGGSWLRVDASPGERFPSVDRQFAPGSIPGFVGDRTEFAVYGGDLTFDLLDSEIPAAGLNVSVEARRYDDSGQNALGFTRYVGDVKAYVPLGYRNRYLAFRARTSHALPDSGQRVPFYLMETIGGARTLRGYSEYRFRDTRNLLLSAEYRWEVWTHVDFVFFLDAGKVFSDSNDFNLSGLHTGYGFGARAHAPGGFVLRFDLARSTEGYKFHIGAGPSF